MLTKNKGENNDQFHSVGNVLEFSFLLFSRKPWQPLSGDPNFPSTQYWGGKKFQKTFCPRTHLTLGWGKKFKKLFICKHVLPSLLAYCRDERVPPSTGVEFKFLPQNFSVLVPAQYWGEKVSSKLDPQTGWSLVPIQYWDGEIFQFSFDIFKVAPCGGNPKFSPF